MLTDYLIYVKNVKRFKIEDIDTKLSLNLNEEERNKLQRQKNILLADQYVERVQNIFSASPFVNTEDFYAAQIINENTDYKISYVDGKTSNVMIIFLGIFFGAIIGICIVLLNYAVKSKLNYFIKI